MMTELKSDVLEWSVVVGYELRTVLVGHKFGIPPLRGEIRDSRSQQVKTSLRNRVAQAQLDDLPAGHDCQPA
jgi:hypothetical protein